MTGTQQVLLFVVIAALLTICGVVWLEHRRHAADERAYEDELDQEFGGTRDETTATETLPPLPAEDLVGSDDRDRPIAAVSMERTGDDSPAMDTDPPDHSVSQDVPAADPGGRVAVAVSSLTPAQRRRAVKKGRIPRNVPAVVGHLGDTGHHGGAHNLPSPAHQDEQREGVQPGHRSLTGIQRVPPRAPGRAGEFHPHHERIPRPLEVWDPMMRAWMPVFPTLLESARHEAHFRQWETEMAAMIDGAYAWLETAA